MRKLLLTFLAVAGLTTLALLVGAGRASAATPVPPFSQCPPVGLDTSCAVLIVYNPDGSRVTLTDPTQPPFDGIEDTLVGVQNNSSSSVSSTPLSGPNIFAFDGDGLCSGVAPGNPPPGGCPYGPTRYEGRSTNTAVASTAPGQGDSFSFSDFNTGSVNFSPAIPSGGSAYFSLEGPASSIAPPVCGVVTSVTLSPATAVNPVSTNHTVTATVTDNCGKPVPHVTVYFTVTRTPPPGTSGTCTTDSSGTCSFTYPGPILPAQDAITGCAGGGFNMPPCGTASKTWVLPVSNPLCTIDITQGGWMIANNGDKVSFGGTAFTDNNSAPSGQEQYTDTPATLDVHSIDIKAITCSRDLETADIYGDATINGSGNHVFRIEVSDPDSTSGSDTYWITLDTGYDSGSHPLGGGHVEIHHT